MNNFLSTFLSKENKYALDNEILSKLISLESVNDHEKYSMGTGTKVIFTLNRQGIVYGFMAYGTTGYSVKQYDIVSSGISTLCFHTINTIRAFTNDTHNTKINSDPPVFALALPNLKNGFSSDISKILLKSMVNSILDLHSQYEEYIKVFVVWDN